MVGFLVIFKALFSFTGKHHPYPLLRPELCREPWLKTQQFVSGESVDDILGALCNDLGVNFTEFWHCRGKSWLSCCHAPGTWGAHSCITRTLLAACAWMLTQNPSQHSTLLLLGLRKQIQREVTLMIRVSVQGSILLLLLI